MFLIVFGCIAGFGRREECITGALKISFVDPLMCLDPTLSHYGLWWESWESWGLGVMSHQHHHPPPPSLSGPSTRQTLNNGPWMAMAHFQRRQRKAHTMDNIFIICNIREHVTKTTMELRSDWGEVKSQIILLIIWKDLASHLSSKGRGSPAKSLKNQEQTIWLYVD